VVQLGKEGEASVQAKSFWTLLPLSMERIAGGGHRYVQSGVFHLPLLEGPVCDAPLALACLSSKDKPPPIRLSDGAMLVVKVLNPLLKTLILPELLAGKPNIQTLFMEKLLRSAAAGVSGAGAKMDKFTLDPAKFPVGGGSGDKTVQAQLPKKKATAEGVQLLLETVNVAFEKATGLGPPEAVDSSPR